MQLEEFQAYINKAQVILNKLVDEWRRLNGLTIIGDISPPIISSPQNALAVMIKLEEEIIKYQDYIKEFNGMETITKFNAIVYRLGLE